MDCRSGNFKCQLGQYCNAPQISGNSAANILASHVEKFRVPADLPPLGPGQFDVMVVGDVPAFYDEKRRLPFQDDAGRLILEFLQKAGHNLNRVYMTKIVKCMPRKKVKPTVTQIHTCRDEYLKKEIELLDPKVIILVGATALRAFNLLGHGSINSIHGKVYEVPVAGGDESKTYSVIPTISPGQFFYRPNDKLKTRIAHDYVVAKDIVEGREPTDHFIPQNLHVIDSDEKLAWLEEQLTSVTMFGWDTESTKLGFRRASLLNFSFAWDWDQCAVLPIFNHQPGLPKEVEEHTKPGYGKLNHDKIKAMLKRVMENPNIAKAAHNIKYDMNVLRWNYGIKIKGFLLDTLIMKHLMDENPPSDLAFLCDLEFAWGDYEAARRKITGHGKKLKATFDKVPDDIMYRYTGTDSLGTYRLARTYAERLQARPNLWKFYIEESEPLLRALAKAEYKGSLVDTNVIDALEKEWHDDQAELLTKLRANTNPEFNPMSNPQVLSAFLALGVPEVDLEDDTAASGYSTNKNTLNMLVEKNVEPAASFANALLTYRNRNKMIGTYIENAREDLNSDGRLRYTWMQAGPVTGRLSCRFFHQIPKIDEERVKAGKYIMRDMFIAPPKYKYVYGDFSQVELRILAILAQDEEMLKILNDPKGDLHRATAFEFLRGVWPGLTPEMISKKNRTEVGKRINFGLAYGSEGFSLVATGKWYDKNDVERNFTWDMLNEGMARWKARFKGVGRFIENAPLEARTNGGTAVNVFGRERHYGPLLSSSNEYERKAAERECVNFYIQSVASCITNRTIIAIDRLLEEHDVSEDDICLVNTVHDSMAYEVADHLVEWFTNAVTIITQRTWSEMYDNTFRLDVGVGQSWHLAEVA